MVNAFSIDPNKGVVASENRDGLPKDISNVNSEVKYYQISNFKAHIEPFDGNYREAIAMVNRFAETLRSINSVYDIRIESFPLDIRQG